jgi:hypothetical protein
VRFTVAPSSYSNVFAYLAAIPGLIFAIGMAALTKESIGVWIVAGALFGLVIAAIGTPRLVGDSTVIPFSNRDEFVANLNVAGAQSGYEPDATVNDFLTYAPNEKSTYSIGPVKLAPAGFLRLGVQLESGQATLVGPKSLLTQLKQRLT